MAVLLDRKFLGRGVARTLLITPFLVMPVVAGRHRAVERYKSRVATSPPTTGK